MKKISLCLIACMLASMLFGCTSGSKDTGSVPDSTVLSASETISNEAPAAAEPAKEEPDADSKDETAAPEQETAAELPVYELPLTEDKVSFSIWCEGASPTVAASLGDDGSYNGSEATLYLEDLLGVHIDYVEVDMFSMAENFSLMVASGDYTDILTSFDSNYAGGVTVGYENEVIIAVDDLVAEMPHYAAYLDAHPEYAKLATSDNGLMLFISSFCEENYTQQGGCIRQDWLDALDLDTPTTFDEMTEVARAFKNAYNSSATIYLTKNYNPMYAFSSGFDLPAFDFTVTGSGFYQIDGEIQCAYVRDEFKEMVKLIQSWYEEGLVSPDFFAMGGGGDAQTMINNDQVGICWNRAESITDYNTQLADTGFQFAGIPGTLRESGQVLHFAPEEPGIYMTFSISSTCDNLDVLAKWLDWGFTTEGILFGNYGMEGFSYELDQNGEPQFTEAMLDHNVGFKQSSERYMRHAAPTVMDVDCGFAGIYDEVGLAAIEMWNSNYDGAYDLPSTLSLTSEENEVYSAKITDCETFIQEWVMKSTFDGTDIDAQWDNYVDTVFSYGLQECIDIQQASYDRFLSR